MRSFWDRLLDRDCRCGFLERAAREPDCPIKRDAGGDRFFVKYDAQNRTKLVFHNCPACGGKVSYSIAAKRLRRSAEYASASV